MSRYGCYNRPPLDTELAVQDGWDEFRHVSGTTGESTRFPRMIVVDDPMSKECQYSLTAADPRCAGCKNNRAEQLNEGTAS